MNPSQPFHPWVAPLGWLALEAAVIVLAALAVQPILRTAATRRSLWRAVLLALVAILALEFTGTGSQLPAQLRLAWQTTFPQPALPIPPPIAIPLTEPPDSAPITYHPFAIPSEALPEPLPFTPAHLPAFSPAPLPTLPPAPTPWPAFLWLTGLAALLTRAAWTHAGFAWLRLRHFLPAAEALRDRVQTLAARLGLRRRVRVLASARLHAPAAFGWVRPGVAVPGDFTARFAPAQQDVMLAHELAHLAARDPLWQLLADLAVAALWWHPLAWVARHQHRLAAELAADDASQALPDGPVVLAECLLVLGQEAAAAPRAPLGMAGFRSQLGRRVERLVALPRRDWSAPGPLRLALQTTVALLALAALALLPGCAANRTESEPPSRLVAKWWQAKSKTPETQPRGATLLIQPQPKPVTVGGRVRFNGTPPAERPTPLSAPLVNALLPKAKEADQQRKKLSADLQRALEEYKPLGATPVDSPPEVIRAVREKQREIESLETKITDFDRNARYRLGKDQASVALMSRHHRVSPDGGLADVLVYVKEGLPNQTFPAPTNTHSIRIQDYEYQPYITAVQTGQPIRWETDVNLNFHPTPTNPANREFNRVLDPGRPVEATFTAPEFFLRTKDDVHPWLFGYVSVLPHPYFAVTDAEGRFRFPQPLPPGKYTLAAVHRQAGTETRELVVDASRAATKPMTFSFGAVTGRDAILRKLAETRLPEVTFDGLPLSEVVKMLEYDARKNDPAKRGVRFALDASKTNSPTAVDLETVLVKVTTVLRDVSLLETLDAILKTADAHRPTDGQSAALEYQIETDRVVFRERTKPAPVAAPAPDALTQRQREIRQRLEAVVLPSVQYDGLPLPEVIKFLGADAKRYDPEKKGFNFLVSSTGQPGSAEQQVDLDTVLIQHATVRKNATVREVLDAICQTAEVRRPDGRRGHLQYTVESFGILFTPDHSRITNAKPVAPPALVPPHAPLPAATPPTSAPPSTSRPINAALAREHCDRLEALVKAVRANPATTAQDYANVAGLIEQALTEYAAVLPPTAPELARLKKLLEGVKPLAPKPKAEAAPSPFAERGEKVAEGRLRGAATNADAANPSPQPSPLSAKREREQTPPVGDDVRSLTPTRNADGGTRDVEASQSLVTSSPTPVEVRDTDAARRQEQREALERLLAEAKQFLRATSWTNAVVRYEEAAELARRLSLVSGSREEEKASQRLAPTAPATAAAVHDPNEMAEISRQLADALAGLTYCRIQSADALLEQLQFKAATEEVDKVLPFVPNSPQAAEFHKFIGRVMATQSRSLPGSTVEGPIADRRRLSALIHDGYAYYQLSDSSKAREKLEAAIELDPRNAEAHRILRLVAQLEFDKAWIARQPRTRRVIETSKKWSHSQRTDLPVPNPYFRTNSQVPFLTHSSKGAQRINRKLEEIVLPEVHFDAVPLVGVVQRLIEDAKKFDPEPDPAKKGLNFLINDVAPAAPLLDAAGNPVPVARPVALSEGLVRVTQPLKNLTLRQALDAICKTAELPTQFSVEEYAIAFIPRGPVAYYSRIFRVNPDTFIQGLQGVVGNPVLGVTPGVGNAAGQNQPANTSTTTGPVRATVPATIPATQRTAAEANALVRQFFQSAGVTALGVTNGSTRVTFNPANGLLQVRGTTNDLRLIEQAIQKVQPPLLTPTNAVPAAPTNALPKPNVYYRTNSEVPFLTHSSKGAQRINAKLDEIILPEIHFDGVSLPAVVTWLDGNVKKHDPDKKGLNFLINNVATDYISLNSTPSPAAPVLDPKGNPIASPAVKPPRPDLESALIRVTKPIKDLTLRQALDVICMTATVKMPDGRIAGLKFTVEEYAIVFSPKLPEQASLFARTFKVDPEAFMEGLRTVAFDEKQLKPGTRAALEQALRERAWTNAPAGTNRFSVAGVAVTKNGVVGVRSTNVTSELNHLVRVYFTAAGVANLGATNGPDATQVFFNDRNGLLFVRASLQDLEIIQQAVELLDVQPPQVLIEAKLVAFDQNDSKAEITDPSGVFPLAALSSGTTTFKSLTNKLVTTITGTLTAPQFAVVLRALEQRDGTEVMSLPKMITMCGKYAGLELPVDALAKSGIAKGFKLEVLPGVADDGRALNLAIIFSRDGRSAVSQCVVWDRQTMMLGFFGPAAANAKPGTKPPRHVLFLTPTLVDAAGDRIHTPTDEMPFVPTTPASSNPTGIYPGPTSRP